VGQTVAASLQAPTLFTIANDLTKMQVLASIDEADVGQIKPGIKANFSVDAYPGETFTGDISQLRLNAQTLQNVVTYSAVIDVTNTDLKLRPGMTANITVGVARRDNVLTVPNAALRFKPNLSDAELQQKLDQRKQERDAQRQAQGGQEGQQPAGGQSNSNAQGQEQQPNAPNAQGQDQRQGNENRQRGGGAPGGQTGQGAQGGQQSGAGSGQRRQGQMIWILTGPKTIEPRFVRAGLTNGRVTEIMGPDIREGDTVIIGQNDTGSGNRQTPAATPFGQQRTPGMGGGGRPPGR
jgi:HlyD family secretion protein